MKWPPLTEYQEMSLKTTHLRTQNAVNIVKSGRTPIELLIKVIYKYINSYSHITAIHLNNDKSLPTAILHKNKIMSSNIPSPCKLGYGIVIDGLDSSHHVTLFIVLNDKPVLINTNDSYGDEYLEYLTKYGIDYMYIPLQQYATEAGGCGPAVLLLLKYLIETRFDSLEKLYQKICDFCDMPKIHLQKEYYDAVNLIVKELPTDTDLSYLCNLKKSSCKWCN